MSERSVRPQPAAFNLFLLFTLVLIATAGVFTPLPVQAEITTNVDDRVKVRFSGIRYDRHEKVFETWVKVKNVSSTDIPAPLRLAITEFKNDRFSLANADGVASGGAYYVDLNLDSDVLGVDETSRWTRVTLKKEKRRHGRWWGHWKHHHGSHRRGGKPHGHWNHHTHHGHVSHHDWRHHRHIKFDYEILGGSEIAASTPTSFPYAVVPGGGNVDVLFRANLLSEGVAPPANVLLRNLTNNTETLMTDGGISGDVTAGDGIYVANESVNTGALAAGDCLTYVSVVTGPQGNEIVSSEYQLCATNLPQRLADSDTSPANQTPINGAFAIGNEVLVNLSKGVSVDVLQQALNQVGGTVVGTSLLSGLHQIQLPGTLNASQLEQVIALFESIDGVSSAGPNYIGSYTSEPDDAEYMLGNQHGLQLVSSDDLAATPSYVWDANATGSGVTVTVLDSGIDALHPDLAGQVVAEIFAGANTDSLGHGTEMAGIIGANTDNTIGVAAVARDVSLESIVVSIDAAVTQAEMIAGFNDAASPLSAGTVVNAAFSIFPIIIPDAGMCGSIDTLISGGSVVVNSAGNDNFNTNSWPGLCNDAASDALHPGDVISSANKGSFIVVGASNCTSGNCAVDSKKADSNFGSWVDIGAPGVSLPTTTIASVDASLYTTSDGTSAASAMVSGASAVLLSCGVPANQVFNTLDLGATVAITGDFNRINLYDSLLPTNTAPTGVNLSSNTIDENVNTAGGSVIGTLSTSDATVCDSHVYSVTGGADAANFSITGNQLRLDDGVLDFETKSSYSVQVTSTDFYGQTTSQTLTVNVNDIEPESLSSDFGADPSGDSGGEGCCDISFVSAMSSATDLTVSIRFHPGYDPTLISTTINIDTDQNTATGQPGVSAGGTIDAAQIGTDYIAFRAGRDGAATVPINVYVGPPINTFNNVGSADVTYVADGYDVVIPLSLLGGDDGFMDVKVISAKRLSAAGNTGILDIAPDEGSAPLMLNP